MGVCLQTKQQCKLDDEAGCTEENWVEDDCHGGPSGQPPGDQSLVGIVHTLGGGVQCWLIEHLGLDALALLVIVWRATENIHQASLLMVRSMRNPMGRQCQLQTAAVGQIAPTNDGEGGGLSTPLHEPPPPSLPPQVATEHEIEEKRTQPGGAEPARQPPPPSPQAHIGELATGTDDERKEGHLREDQGAGDTMSATQPPPPPLPPPPHPQALTRDVATDSGARQEDL